MEFAFRGGKWEQTAKWECDTNSFVISGMVEGSAYLTMMGGEFKYDVKRNRRFGLVVTSIDSVDCYGVVRRKYRFSYSDAVLT